MIFLKDCTDAVLKLIDWLNNNFGGGGGGPGVSIWLGVALGDTQWCYHYVINSITGEVYTDM